MDFLGWSLLVLLSLWASAHAFYWGLKSGQFADPERARYLALPEDLPSTPAPLPAPRRGVTWALRGVLLLAGLGWAGALVLSLLHGTR